MTDSQILFSEQPDSASLWIFTADRNMNNDEQASLLKSLSGFLTSWTSHEQAVVADATVLENRFLVVCGHIPGGDVSGCGIDKLVHAVESAASTFDVGWLGGLDIVFRDATGTICATSRSSFREMVAASEVDTRTMVFDTSLNLLQQLRATGLMQPAGKAWHGSVFHLQETIGV